MIQTPDSQSLCWRERRERDIHMPHALEAFREYAVGRWPDRPIENSVEKRRREIDELPTVTWRGRTLKTIRCLRCGQLRNLPPSALWVVIDVKHVICAWCFTRG